MKEWISDHKEILILGGIIGGISLGIYLSKKNHLKSRFRSKSLGAGRKRTKARTDSRDLSGAKRGENKKVEKDSTPILSPTTFSSKSRSSVTASVGNERTSKVNVTSTRPVNVFSIEPIRKYPPNYYTLSKKAQWKYRKTLNRGNPVAV